RRARLRRRRRVAAPPDATRRAARGRGAADAEGRGQEEVLQLRSSRVHASWPSRSGRSRHDRRLMKYRYTKYTGDELDELDLEDLVSKLSDLLLSSGFGNPYGIDDSELTAPG